jgi:hypothetical protein
MDQLGITNKKTETFCDIGTNYCQVVRHVYFPIIANSETYMLNTSNAPRRRDSPSYLGFCLTFLTAGSRRVGFVNLRCKSASSSMVAGDNREMEDFNNVATLVALSHAAPSQPRARQIARSSRRVPLE